MDEVRRSVPVLNSLVFILDAKETTIPDISGIGAYWKTNKCVAISCLPDCEGDTEIVLTTRSVPPGSLKLLVDVRLETPSKRLAVELVPHRRIAELDVPSTSVTLEIWTDGYRDTETIFAIIRSPT